MSLLAQLKEKRGERKKTLDAAGAILTKAFNDNKRSLTADEDKEFETRHADGDRMLKEIERLEKQLDSDRQLADPACDARTAGMEDVRESADALAIDDKTKKKCVELRSVKLRAWLASGVDNLGPHLRARHDALEAAVGREYRALSAITAALGETTIPTGFVYNLESALKYYGGVIDAADYIPTENGAPLPYPTDNDTGNTAEVLAENSQVAGTTGGAAESDPAYGVVNFLAYMLDTGMVRVPIQLLQDTAFDIDTFLTDKLTIRIGRKLNTKCTVGAGPGSSEPTGVMTAATLGVLTASGVAISYNDLLNLFHSIDPAYRVGPKVGWMFNDSTLLAIKKLVDGNGRPLFIAGGTAEGIEAPTPDRLHDKPYWINQDMATIAVNAKTIAFGDWSKYKIRQVRQIQMAKLSERFIDLLQIGFIAYQRFDGNLVDAGTHPIKYLQQNAS